MADADEVKNRTKEIIDLLDRQITLLTTGADQVAALDRNTKAALQSSKRPELQAMLTHGNAAATYLSTAAKTLQMAVTAANDYLTKNN